MSAFPIFGPSSAETSTVKEAYRHCARITRRSGSSFLAAFWMFPPEQRQAMHAIYAFCRLADDIADDPETAGDRGALLSRWRAELVDAYLGKSSHPVVIALGDAVHRYKLPQEWFDSLLDGIEFDLAEEPIERFEDLERYCYRVASTIGLLVVGVRGVRGPAIDAYATQMGIAVQLTNVLRDVGDDARDGRIYLAREDLERFGVDPASILERRHSDALRELMAAYAERARIRYERAASQLPPELLRRLRPAQAMGAIYRELLDTIQARGFPCFEGPVRQSKRRRIAIAGSVWVGLGR